MHTLFVFGTRPEAIKLLPLARVLRERGERVTLLSTSQHTDLLSSPLEAFHMSTDLTLPPLPRVRSLTRMLRHFVSHLPRYLRECAPDAVVVQGDTMSAFSGALCAFLEGLPLIHIEAGLRTYERTSPYPEEALRRMIAPLANVHFTTTDEARAHLLTEGVRAPIYTVGNTVYDAMRLLCPTPQPSTPPYLLITTHRRENDGAPREDILRAIRRLASLYPSLVFHLVLNENKSIQALVHRMLDGVTNITLHRQMRPDRFYALLSGATLVLTDSGGVSEEASALGLPTLVLREHTEREWELRQGRLTLVGTAEEGIVEAVSSYLIKLKEGTPTASAIDMPSSVSERIADILQRITL